MRCVLDTDKDCVLNYEIAREYGIHGISSYVVIVYLTVNSLDKIVQSYER